MESQYPGNHECGRGSNPDYWQSPNPSCDNTDRPKTPPKTWLVESILVTIFCCIPFGVVGIVQAARVESLFYANRFEEAERASRDAKRWTVIGFWIGLAVTLLYVLYAVFRASFGIGSSIL